MKLLIKILLFVLAALVTNVKVISAAITFPNIQEVTISSSFQNETPKTVFKVIKNNETTYCQNKQNLVDYRSWGIGVEVVAAKTGANIGTKLEYVFGKATGSAHNIERSTGMLRQLESVGIFDNAAGRS
ncbi:hypothetical protein, partial [Olivibacter ginsenosidimutans]|uniref:hypothetical protein n=1 Tax=Olivibacter ginsenosidimutans TaxID=1176537 RepID=UPI0031F1BB81